MGITRRQSIASHVHNLSTTPAKWGKAGQRGHRQQKLFSRPGYYIWLSESFLPPILVKNMESSEEQHCGCARGALSIPAPYPAPPIHALYQNAQTPLPLAPLSIVLTSHPHIPSCYYYYELSIEKNGERSSPHNPILQALFFTDKSYRTFNISYDYYCLTKMHNLSILKTVTNPKEFIDNALH